MPKDAFRREVALRLKEARRDQTLTQRQLADLGLSTQQNISRYEKGFIPDSWFLLARLHSEKAIDLNWLLGAAAAAAAAQSGNGAGVPAPARDGRPAPAARSIEPPEPVPAAAGQAPTGVPPELTLISDDLERGGQL